MTTGSTISVSAARTLLLPAPVLDPQTVLRWPTKAPAATGAFTLDIAAWLADINDFVSSFTVVVNSGNAAGLTIGGQQITNASQNSSGLTVILSGGVTGSEYSITFTATSATGAVEQWTVWLYVQNIGASLARQQPTTIGPPGQGFNYRGVWQANTNYNAYDVLTYGASVYECSVSFTSGATFDATPLNLWLEPAPVPFSPMEITQDAVLSSALHYGKVLVCSQSVTLTANNFGAIGAGFWCYVVNLSTGNVTMGNGIGAGFEAGNVILQPGAAAQANALSYSGGNIMYFSGVAFTIPTPEITVTNPGTQPDSTTFSVSGTYVGDAPTALDWTINGGSTWTAAVSPTITGDNFVFTITGGVAGGEYVMGVRDHNNTGVSGNSSLFIVGTNTLSVSGGSTGTHGTALTVTGSVMPTGDAVQVALATQNSTAPTSGWINATNASGAISSSGLTPSTTGTFYVWAKDTVSGLTAVSSAVTVS